LRIQARDLAVEKENMPFYVGRDDLIRETNGSEFDFRFWFERKKRSLCYF
jgi:hypothetical protein